MSRRGFLSSAAGMSAAFLAMNEVFGPVFTASRAEAATPGVADARAAALKKQFIVDCQTHFVRDDYSQQMLTFSADFAKKHWNPDIPGSEGLTRYKFQNYVKEIFIDSDTKVAMISGTPTDEYEYLFLTNDQIASARDVVNKVAGSRRTLAHGIVTPGTPGWFEEITRVMTDLKPDSIKGYTIGDPIYQTKKKTNWRMDDEKLRLSAVRGHAQERHQHHLHPQGTDAGRLHDLVGRHVAVRHGLGRGQGRQGLAADQLRHLSLGHAAVPRAARPRAGAVREDRPLRLGLRSRRHSRRSSA